eukprot:765499-Hanusia_phi.AAC.2
MEVEQSSRVSKNKRRQLTGVQQGMEVMEVKEDGQGAAAGESEVTGIDVAYSASSQQGRRRGPVASREAKDPSRRAPLQGAGRAWQTRQLDDLSEQPDLHTGREQVPSSLMLSGISSPLLPMQPATSQPFLPSNSSAFATSSCPLAFSCRARYCLSPHGRRAGVGHGRREEEARRAGPPAPRSGCWSSARGARSRSDRRFGRPGGHALHVLHTCASCDTLHSLDASASRRLFLTS